MKQIAIFSMLAATCALISSCEKEDAKPDNSSKMEINITASTDTRASDSGFDAGDKVGIYVVNYKGDTPDTLTATGNHVDNMCFTYNGTWTPATPIYWLDNTTHADLYLYYPYTNILDLAAQPFTVAANQSTKDSYTQSDFMTAKATNVAPTSEAIAMTAQHRMSRASIEVKPGNGFTAESLAKASIAVKINGVKCSSTVNIASGAVTATGEATSVTPLPEAGSYKAIIVPQSVAEGNLITVTIDGRDYNLKKAFTFEAGKNHKFTVTVSKTSNGVNVTIGGWGDGGENGGTAE